MNPLPLSYRAYQAVFSVWDIKPKIGKIKFSSVIATLVLLSAFQNSDYDTPDAVLNSYLKAISIKDRTKISSLLAILVLFFSSSTASTKLNYSVYFPFIRQTFSTEKCMNKIVGGLFACSWYLPFSPINRSTSVQIYAQFLAIDLKTYDLTPREGFSMKVRAIKIVNGEYIGLGRVLCSGITDVNGIANCSFSTQDFPVDTNQFSLTVIVGDAIVNLPVKIE